MPQQAARVNSKRGTSEHHMERIPMRYYQIALLLLAILIPLSQPGCILIPVLYRGRIAPAQCAALEGKTIAVVCTSNSSDFGPSPDAELVARRVSSLLANNVADVQVVAYQRVAAWMDEHDAQYVDYAEIGRDLNADLVVGIDIEALRLQDNSTLYKGQAVYQMEVIDVAEDRIVFETFTPPVIYPKISGLPTTSVSKEQFRRKFTDVLAGDIARHFYEHDLNEQVAIDTPDLDGL